MVAENVWALIEDVIEGDEQRLAQEERKLEQNAIKVSLGAPRPATTGCQVQTESRVDGSDATDERRLDGQGSFLEPASEYQTEQQGE